MLPVCKSILLATDLSHNAGEAFKYAVMLSRPDQATIHLLHVVPEVDNSVRTYVSAVMGEGSLDKFENQHEELARQNIRKALDEFARTELKDHPEDLERIADIVVEHGQPAAKILEVSDELNADLIVMASHGKGALEYTFLGSVTEKVLRKTKRPVFVVPLAD